MILLEMGTVLGTLKLIPRARATGLQSQKNGAVPQLGMKTMNKRQCLPVLMQNIKIILGVVLR